MKYLLCWSNYNIAVVSTSSLSMLPFFGSHPCLSFSSFFINSLLPLPDFEGKSWGQRSHWSDRIPWPCTCSLLCQSHEALCRDYINFHNIYFTLLLHQYPIFKLCKNKSFACPFVTITSVCQFTPSSVNSLIRLIPKSLFWLILI